MLSKAKVFQKALTVEKFQAMSEEELELHFKLSEENKAAFTQVNVSLERQDFNEIGSQVPRYQYKSCLIENWECVNVQQFEGPRLEQSHLWISILCQLKDLICLNLDCLHFLGAILNLPTFNPCSRLSSTMTLS